MPPDREDKGANLIRFIYKPKKQHIFREGGGLRCKEKEEAKEEEKKEDDTNW